MSAIRYYKRLTHGHALTAPLVQPLGDVETAVVRFVMYRADAAVIDTELNATIDDGRCRYVFREGDLPNAGIHVAEFFVTYLDGALQRVPNSGWVDVVVLELEPGEDAPLAPPPQYDAHMARTDNPHGVTVEDLTTSEENTSLRLAPDGEGGVQWLAGGDGTSVGSTQNKGMPARPTSSDGDLASDIALQAPPAGGGHVRLFVNGVATLIGDGVSAGVPAWLSNDAGATARSFGDLEGGETLRWNGSVAGYQLTAQDVIDLDYVV